MNPPWKSGVVMILLMFSLGACSTQTPVTTTEKKSSTETKKEDKKANANANSNSTIAIKQENTNKAEDIIVGTRVASKWSDGNYWAATVTEITGSTYTVNYDDGTKETNTKDRLIPLSNTIELQVGDKVLAVWSSQGRFYEGVVQEVKTGSAIVQWNDGSAPSEVVFGKIILVPSSLTTTTTTIPDNSIAVGARVASKWADGNYWAGTVNAVNGTLYTIKYDDGTTGTNPKENLILLTDTPNLSMGDEVMAVWSSNGRFYDGVIQEFKDETAIIQWKDGSSPSAVELGKILKK